MSTHRAEIDLLVEVARHKGATVEVITDPDTGYIDEIAVANLPGLPDCRCATLAMAEALRPIVGAEAQRPLMSRENDALTFRYSMAQVAAYGHAEDLLRQKVWRNEIPPGMKFQSMAPERLDGDPVTRYWAHQNGDLVALEDKAAFEACQTHLPTKLHSYRLDLSDEADAAEYRDMVFRQECCGLDTPKVQPLGSKQANAMQDVIGLTEQLDGPDVTVNTTFVYQDRWTLMPQDGVSEAAQTVADWAEVTHPDRNIKEGYYLEQTEDMRNLRSYHRNRDNARTTHLSI